MEPVPVDPDVARFDCCRQQALTIAAGHLDVVKVLIDNGARLDIKDRIAEYLVNLGRSS